jgi:nucleotide-binding universal stress UspA family protein
MLTFLIAVDGSAPALRAIEVVARMARAGVPLEVILMNVRGTPHLYGGKPGTGVDAFEAAQKQAQVHLLNDAEAQALGCGLQVRLTLSAQGHPAQEIVRAATEHAVDQIVIGTHGADAMGGGSLLPGSVAQRVLSLSRHPVLLVH